MPARLPSRQHTGAHRAAGLIMPSVVPRRQRDVPASPTTAAPAARDATAARPTISAAAAATFARAPFTATLTALAARTLHRRSELCRQWLGVRRLEGLAVLDRLSTRRHAAAHCFARRLVSERVHRPHAAWLLSALTAVATVAHAITAPATVDATAVAILATGPALIG